MNNSITGIILAGGKSSRMGTDKGLVNLKGHSLINHVIQVVNLMCDDIIIISNQPRYKNLGVPVFEDILKNKGPVGGLHSGLRHSKTQYNLLVACDMPNISFDLIKFVLDNVDGTEDAVVPLNNNQPEPLCGVYAKNCIAQLEKAIDENRFKMQEILKNLNTKYISVDESLPFYTSELFMNVNTMEDLDKIEN